MRLEGARSPLSKSMSLGTCTDCGRPVSTKAERCPHCGAKNPATKPLDDSVPFLISASEVRRRKVKCRECGRAVALGAGSCPECGYASPGEKPGWRVLLIGLLIALALLAAAFAAGFAAIKVGLVDRVALLDRIALLDRTGVLDRIGLLDRRVAVSTAATDSAAIESNFSSNSRRLRKEPPRIRSVQFGAACPAPAPVLVYELDRTPSMFQVRLAREVADPARMTDSLVKRYRLQSAGYDVKRNGVFVWQVSPAVVSALRCESAVSSIDEVSY